MSLPNDVHLLNQLFAQVEAEVLNVNVDVNVDVNVKRQKSD